jgi:hypothetical protein
MHDANVYMAFFLLQNAFYVAVLLSLIFERMGFPSGLLYIPHYFTLVNLASAHAFMKFSAGRKQTTWTPRKGA